MVMIGYLEGNIVFRGEKHIVLNVQGVGYTIFLSAPTQKQIPGEGMVKLWTHLAVKENALELYGFLYPAEREFFESLISISGIGPKSALGVMSLAPVDTLKRAIASGDTSYLTKVSGIGRKTAEKIVLELKDKMGFGKVSYIEGGAMQDDADVMEALIALGYSQKESREMVQNIPAAVQGRDQRLKEALKRK